MADRINIGDVYRATAEFRVNGVLTDPTSVSAKALSPGGVESTLAVIKTATGTYRADIAPTSVGVWRYWFIGVGVAEAVEAGAFTVQAVPGTVRYTSPADVRQTLAPDGTDQQAASTAAALSDAQLADAIAEAQQEVDARLSDRYDTPFDTPPALVGQLTRDIAAYRATLTHRRQAPLPEDHPVRLRYRDARELLKVVKLGEVDMADDETLSVEPAVVNPYSGDLFVRELMGVDSYYR